VTAADSTDPSGDGDSGFGDTERPLHPLRTWRQPLLTAITMSVAVGLVAIVDPNPGPLVLAAALSMTLARNRLVTSWRGRAEAIVLLPVVGLATAGVGYLLLHLLIVGASAYVAALFLSIWFRRFGPTWSRIGSLIALPFITLLIAPAGGPGTTPLVVVVLSVVVLVVVVALRLLAEVVRFVPRPPRPERPARLSPAAGDAAGDASGGAAGDPAELAAGDAAGVAAANAAGVAAAAHGAADSETAPESAAATPRPPTSGRLFVSTKMAIQMAIALSAAFILGYLLFPQHLTWVVLTAFIVCSGNRGRADVLYKSGLRIVGAAIGTVVASLGLLVLPAGHSALQGPLLVVVLLAIIAIGLWLREWTYAAWALAMTLAITLIQGAVQSAAVVGGVPEGTQIWIRILAIIVGAACGVLASWFVLPVRSEGVVRRRVANALSALSEFAAAPGPITDEELADSLDRLDEVAAPWAVWERVSGWRKTTRKPGQWMQLVHECARLVRAAPELSGASRRTLGEARRSMRDPLVIGSALLAFRDELRSGSAE
jgi:hypothetical protein